MTLSNHDLIRLARKYSIPLDSVVSKDMLDRLPHEDNIIINLQDLFNDDGSTNGGTHWVTLSYIPKYNTFVYFDSYGITPPSDVVTYAYRVKSKSTLIYNTTQIQRITTTTCGWYCLAFIQYIDTHKHYTPTSALNRFINEFDRVGGNGEADLIRSNQTLKRMFRWLWKKINIQFNHYIVYCKYNDRRDWI